MYKLKYIFWWSTQNKTGVLTLKITVHCLIYVMSELFDPLVSGLWYMYYFPNSMYICKAL